MTYEPFTGEISKSHLMTWLSCPRRSLYQFIMKLEPLPKGEATQQGIAYHEFFQKWFDAVDIKKPLIESVPAELREDPVILNFLKLEDARLQMFGEKLYFPVVRERYYRHNGCKGIIDRIDFDGSEHVLFEYKPRSDIDSGRRLELAFYTQLVMELNIKKCCVFGYRDGHLQITNLKPITFRKLGESMSNLRKDSEYLPKYGRQCSWCDYAHHCAKDFGAQQAETPQF